MSGYFRKRFEILRAPDSPREARFFAVLEMFCFTASAVTLAGIVPQRFFFADALPEWLPTVLVSAAVGFLTNFLAIEMLFKPYRKSPFHPLTILSCGYWKLGLVPRSQSEIGRELGKQIEQNLLRPEDISAELCAFAANFLTRPQLLETLRARVPGWIDAKKSEIAALLLPGARSMTDSALRMVTREKLLSLYSREIAPLLDSAELRGTLSKEILSQLEKRTPEIAEKIEQELFSGIRDYLATHLPGGIGADMLAQTLMTSLDRDTLEARISQRLADPETAEAIQREIAAAAARLEKQLHAPESAEKIHRFAAALRAKLAAAAGEYLGTALPELLARFAADDFLWDKLRDEILPAAAPLLETTLRELAAEKIAAELDISGRIFSAVENQDVEAFHQMIDAVAARHLAAIQVLGYFLGAAVGAIQELSRLIAA